MDILSTKLGDIKIHPSVTDDFVNIFIQKYLGPILTEIYAMNGDFISTQSGKKLSFKNFNSGIGHTSYDWA